VRPVVDRTRPIGILGVETIRHTLFWLVMCTCWPLLVQAQWRPALALPEDEGHLGVDLQAPGGTEAQEDTPVIWNGPPAEVTFLGSVSKTIDVGQKDGTHGDALHDDAGQGDGYGTMAVILLVRLETPVVLPTEVSGPALIQLITDGQFGRLALPETSFPGLLRLQSDTAFARQLRPLLRAYRTAPRRDKRDLGARILSALEIPTSLRTDRVAVLVGHLRPSRAFVRADDPHERFRVGLAQGDLTYRVGETIPTGTVLGFMERDHYEGTSSAPHVHLGAYVPDQLDDPAWGFRGRGAAPTDAIRGAFLEAEATLQALADLSRD
jgi:hypothetical protein